MKKQDRPLTNEELNKRFGNSFELVDYAINVAKREMFSGKEAQAPVYNLPYRVLRDIAGGKEILQAIPQSESTEGTPSADA